jgi:hypothetical protein
MESILDHEIHGITFHNLGKKSSVTINESGIQFTPANNQASTNITLLCLDTQYKDAASHWVFESGVFLPFFNELKKLYPNLIVYLDGLKMYKALFCQHFGVPYVSTFIPGAEVIVPESFTLMTSSNEMGKYKTIIDNFFIIFEKHRTITPTLDYVILPRQKKENYINNDRVIVFDQLLKFMEETGKQHTILNTDNLTLLESQAMSVAKGKTIILCAGAALHINSLFCQGKTIYVVGPPNMVEQAEKYPKAKYLLEKVSLNNTVVFINDERALVQKLASPIFIYGDSHADYSFHGLDYPHFNQHQKSHTMNRVGRDKVIPNFSKTHDTCQSVFVFAFGEIDARCQIAKQLEAGRELEEIVTTLTTAYVEAIRTHIVNSKKVIITAVIPPTRRHDYESRHGPITHEFPFLGTDVDRVNYTSLINTNLKNLCEKHSLYYFDPYESYRHEDGTLKYELSDNCVHIGPAHTAPIISKLKELLLKGRLL